MPLIGRRQRGFALLMVLWTLMLLAMLATVYGSNARTEVLLARNLVTNAQAEALADAGIFRAATGLTRQPREGGFRGNGQVYIWRPSLEGPDVRGAAAAPVDEVRFTVRDEGGKVDINHAPAPLLRELFVAVGVKPEPAAALADAIVDFRDEDQEKQPNGAEARDYKRAGMAWGPKNKPFDVVDELTYVLGMTPEIYRKVAPLVTVWGLGETPHPYTAPPEVLQAMVELQNGARGRSTADRRSSTTSSSSSRASDSAFSASTSGSRSSFGSSGLGGSSSGGLGSSLNSRGSSGLGSSSSGLGSSLSSRSSGIGSSSSFGSNSATASGSGSLFSRGGGSLFGNSSMSSGEQGAFGADDDDGTDADQQERSGSTTFSVHAEARTIDGTIFARDATIDLTGTEQSPVAIRSWRQGERILFPPAPPLGAPPPPTDRG